MRRLFKKYNKVFRSIALVMLISFINQLFFPSVAWALTSGPSQPEFQSFEPVGTTQMVNLFTGDFGYNIPLLDVGGYPVNIAYHDNITMGSEASWVGLGWNINMGSIARNMRGLPDDFDGDNIVKKFSIKDKALDGSRLGLGFNSYGIGMEAGLGTFYDSYQGVGAEMFLDISLTSGINVGPFSGQAGVGVGINANSQNGIGINPSVSYGGQVSLGVVSKGMSRSTSAQYNTRAGLTSIHSSSGTTLGASIPYVGVSFSETSMSGSTVSLGTQSYTPRIPFNIKGTGDMNSSRTGLWASSALWMYKIDEDYTKTSTLKEIRKAMKGYGYLYEQNGQESYDKGGINKQYILLDFNREKERIQIPENMPNLFVTNHTYDIYKAAAQGVNAMYRPHRNEVGTVFNPTTASNSRIDLETKERGYGLIYHKADGDGSIIVAGKSKLWDDLSLGWNQARDLMRFKGNDPANPEFESFYFKNAGEKTASRSSFYNQYGGEDPIEVKIQLTATVPLYDWIIIEAKPEFKKSTGATFSIPTENRNLERKKRNELFSFLTTDEAEDYALTQNIEGYVEYTEPSDGTTSLNIDDSRGTLHPSHHLSELSVLNPDGRRYVYGIPAYNNKQSEVTFNIANNRNSASCASGTVSYTAGVHNSTGNVSGKNNMYSKVKLPAYAHSYLLTAVLSSDYVDVTGDGPSEDDLGDYTRFNYSRAYNDYKWRIPYSKQTPAQGDPIAYYNDQFKSDLTDDMASYVYGEKDIWYVHSIESKNIVAEFYMDAREDGFGVEGEDGVIDLTKPLKKLKKIVLYTKEDRINNGTNAVPLKTVHFEYDYSLCGNVPNNSTNPVDVDGNTVATESPDNVNSNEGKLTLKKIYFTYGESKKGRLSPYQFTYAGNEDYDLMSSDRWGTYKLNNCDLPNADFPYAEQVQSSADLNAAVWKLSTVELPSGSEINISYESDDYGYVQNRQAMEMFIIEGVSSSSTFSTAGSMYNNLINSNSYIHFKLKDPVDNANQLKQKYFNGIEKLFFKCAVDLADDGDVDYVPGYAEIEDDEIGVSGASPHSYGWVKLKNVTVGDPLTIINGLSIPPLLLSNLEINPIVKAAWQYTRLNVPDKIYPTMNCSSGDIACMMQYFISQGMDINTIISGGLNVALKRKNFSKKLIVGESWIRLLNPDKKKLGGGARVKELTVNDGWGSMGGSDFTYGQTFTYEINGDGGVISSGVAGYEPEIGNDENPFRQPVAYSVTHLLAPDDHHYQETPFGESYFPAPVVGYRSVQVTNKEHVGVDVKRTATGHVEHEFYTAFDFPTLTGKTPLAPLRVKSKPKFLQKVTGIVMDYFGGSQGFVIEKNDMHGKPRGRKVYAERGAGQAVTLVSSVEIRYRRDGAAGKLNNNVQVINQDGSVTSKIMGRDIDITADMSHNQVASVTSLNVDVHDFGLTISSNFLPFISHSNLKSIEESLQKYRSSVITKVIYRTGLVDKIVVTNQGSTTTQSNLAYDAETGEVLLSSIQNGFKDPVFSFNYPAHWVYDGMGPAYKNIGISLVSGTHTYEDYLAVGDEVTRSSGNKAWILQVNGGVIAINRDGNLVTLGDTKVLRSGRKNMQNISVGNIVSLDDPIVDDGVGGYKIEFDGVLNASSSEFSDKWPVFCNTDCNTWPDDPVNPYVKGIKGNYRPVSGYTYFVNQASSSTGTATNTREDGTFESFTSFWDYDGVSEWVVPIHNSAHTSYNAADLYQDWLLTREVTLYNTLGAALESKDVLNRYSATLFGYNKDLSNLPIAAASNAKYSQIAYDGFEDYDYRDDLGAVPCTLDGHWNFMEGLSANADADIDATMGHTGRRSLGLTPPQTQHMVSRVIQDCADVTSSPGSDGRFYVDPCDCISNFSPEEGKYVVSAWVKEWQQSANPQVPVATYGDAKISVVTKDDGSAVINTNTFTATGPVIEGWQRIEGVFDITSNAASIEVTLLNASSTMLANFDDIRIHPLAANMKTVVYDPLTLRVVAEMDAYNFATFYEYNEEGTMVRVKKETERGILTLNETRGSLQKN